MFGLVSVQNSSVFRLPHLSHKVCCVYQDSLYYHPSYISFSLETELATTNKVLENTRAENEDLTAAKERLEDVIAAAAMTLKEVSGTKYTKFSNILHVLLWICHG